MLTRQNVFNKQIIVNDKDNDNNYSDDNAITNKKEVNEWKTQRRFVKRIQ